MRAALPLALVLLLALAPRPALAQQNAEVRKFVNAAITLYENLEYEKALKQLQKAKAKAQGSEDETRINLLEGIVLTDMGKEEKALMSFKTGFGLDVNAKLPVEVSPKVSLVAEKARANVKRALAPQLEAEEQRLAEEKKRLADEAAKKKEEDEAKLRAQPPPPLPPPAVVVLEREPSPVRKYSWVPGVVGLASAGAAAGMLIVASGKQSALINQTLATPEEAVAARDSGKLFATLGYVFTGVAVAGVATAVVMFLVGGSSAPESAPAPVALSVGAGGGMVTLTLPFDLGAAR
jgi:tetratricopeptide (TPR) repeat protein